MVSLSITFGGLTSNVTSATRNLSKCHTSKNIARISKTLFTHESKSDSEEIPKVKGSQIHCKTQKSIVRVILRKRCKVTETLLLQTTNRSDLYLSNRVSPMTLSTSEVIYQMWFLVQLYTCTHTWQDFSWYKASRNSSATCSRPSYCIIRRVLGSR